MTKNFVGNCGSATDARFATGDLGGADGSYNCTDRDGSKCFHAVLTFDRQNITSYNDWRQTTCHEIGHSVGLTHEQGSGDCMGYNSSNQSYSPHHVDHINNDR